MVWGRCYRPIAIKKNIGIYFSYDLAVEKKVMFDSFPFPINLQMEEENMTMKQISVERAKEIANEKNLAPAMVDKTDGILQFTKKGGGNDRLKEVSWDDFKKKLEERKLAIYESGGWMKIMAK